MLLLAIGTLEFIGCKGAEPPDVPKTPQAPGGMASSAKGTDHISVDGDKAQLVTIDSAGVLTASPATGVLRPLPQAEELDAADFEEDSLAVATVKATAAFPDLELQDSQEDTLYLYKPTPTTWAAIVQNGPGYRKPLKVVRYNYANTTAKDIPNTARFDTLEKKQAIGVRCGDAWCMIGKYLATVNESTDPQENGALDKPHRIRGYFDRKDRPAAGGKSYSVYPVEDLAKKKRQIYVNGFDQVATIEAGDGSVKAKVLLKYTPATDKWTFRFKNGALVYDVEMTTPRERHLDKRVPGSARWDKSDAGLKPNMIMVGTMWVRCANGCCSVEAAIPT